MARDASSIHQFRALAAVEQALARDPSAAGPALERLAEPLDLGRDTAVGVESLASRSGAEDPLAHAREHWLGQVYFPNISDAVVLEALRAGFEAALRDARTEGKQLVPVWVCVDEDPASTVFRVDHVVTDTSVVVAIMTPRPTR